MTRNRYVPGLLQHTHTHTHTHTLSRSDMSFCTYAYRDAEPIKPKSINKHYIPLASSRMNCPIGLPTGTDPITGKNNKRTMTVRCENVPVAPLEAITVEKR